MSYLLWGAGLVILYIALRQFRKWNLKPVHWEPQEVTELLESWIEGEVDHRSWDYFEACEISDPVLEEIRLEALDATYWDSPYIDACGTSEEALNEKGIEKFRRLIEKAKLKIENT